MNRKSNAPVVILATICISIAGVLLVIIAWMNLTPGYFQYGDCFCKVGYFTNQQIETDRQNPRCHLLDCQPPSKFGSWLWKLELNLARLDFNRGPKVSTPIENLPEEPPTSKPEESGGKFCGGFAANLPQNQCPTGYRCQLDGNFPDAGGKCVRN